MTASHSFLWQPNSFTSHKRLRSLNGMILKPMLKSWQKRRKLNGRRKLSVSNACWHIKGIRSIICPWKEVATPSAQPEENKIVPLGDLSSLYFMTDVYWDRPRQVLNYCSIVFSFFMKTAFPHVGFYNINIHPFKQQYNQCFQIAHSRIYYMLLMMSSQHNNVQNLLQIYGQVLDWLVLLRNQAVLHKLTFG